MMKICENFAKSHNIVFNSSKTKLLCYNKDPQTVIPPIYLNGEQVSVVEHEKHLGNFLSTNIYDRNIISNVCDLYQRSNLLISDFRVCDCITLQNILHLKIYFKTHQTAPHFQNFLSGASICPELPNICVQL